MKTPLEIANDVIGEENLWDEVPVILAREVKRLSAALITFCRLAKYERDAALEENRLLRKVLLMVLGSTLMETDGHDWRKCKQPSCVAARAALKERE
jgi:hypothetical protein